MGLTVLAIGCHPDDIEFMMAGTLLLLKTAGCTLHYMNLADGRCGTTRYDVAEIVAIRRGEAQAAAGLLGAAYHESLVPDLEVFYLQPLIRKVTAVIRQVVPEILLLPSPEDYMEDHMNTSRIGVTAAFCRGMRNFASDPPSDPTFQDVALYHALPYGLHDGMRRRIAPDFVVDISSVIDIKERMLACHESQKGWLDESQGLDSYLVTMREMSAEVARLFGSAPAAARAATAAATGTEGAPPAFAEGWRRHSHLGYSEREIDPLQDILPGYCRPVHTREV
jgi:LmbE family N-acetylglucosaminyl deacetylase